MLFSWLRQRQREKILAEPFLSGWLPYLSKNVAHYRYLSEAEQARLRDDLRIFIAEKQWEGCGGLSNDRRDQGDHLGARRCCWCWAWSTTTSTASCRSWSIRHGYRAVDGERLPASHHRRRHSDRLGEAHYRGPVILSWRRRDRRRPAPQRTARTWSITNSPTSSTCSTAPSTARRLCGRGSSPSRWKQGDDRWSTRTWCGRRSTAGRRSWTSTARPTKRSSSPWRRNASSTSQCRWPTGIRSFTICCANIFGKTRRQGADIGADEACFSPVVSVVGWEKRGPFRKRRCSASAGQTAFDPPAIAVDNYSNRPHPREATDGIPGRSDQPHERARR